MRILLVKTSSLGDVIHNLPVVSDLRARFPAARIDWCVEESFAELPRLHPAVATSLPVALRRWRKNPFRRSTWNEIGEFAELLRGVAYDAILDTQGLVKSALLARFARGTRYGYSARSAREPWASGFYDRVFDIPTGIHAVVRNRRLSATAFAYSAEIVETPPDYGICAPGADFPWLDASRPLAVFFTATSRDDKLWREEDWVSLGRRLADRGLMPVLPSGQRAERQRAERIARQVPGALLVPALSLGQVAALLGRARLAVGVDTGLIHLAAALRVPTVALYVSTDPALTGVHGAGAQRNLGGPGRTPSVADVVAALDAVEREASA